MHPGHEGIEALPGQRLTIQIVVWTQCLVGLMLMIFRVYTNAKILKRWRMDFWLALATFVSACIILFPPTPSESDWHK